MSAGPFYRSHDLPTCRGLDGARCPRSPEPDGLCLEHGAVIEARGATIVKDFGEGPWRTDHGGGPPTGWREAAAVAWARQQAGRVVPL